MRRCRWLLVGMGVGGCITWVPVPIPCSSLLGEKVPHLLPRREIGGVLCWLIVGVVRGRDFLRRSAAGQLHEWHGRQGGAVYRQGCQCERHELGGTGCYAFGGRGCDGEYGAEE